MPHGIDTICHWNEFQHHVNVAAHSIFNMPFPKGGFVIIRHNEIRDITAELLTEICKNVTVEPALTPLTGETFPKASAITSNYARAMCLLGVSGSKGKQRIAM